MRLRGKVCAITGAGSGIGRAAAVRFTQEGAVVAVLEIDARAGQACADELAAAGSPGAFVPCDLADEQSVQSAFAVIAQRWGRLDVLYNNASLFLRNADGPIDRITDEAWQRILSVNLTGTMRCCRAGIPLMRQAGGGSIIMTASSAAVIGVPGCAAYTASKGAVVALTREMAIEYGPQGIRTNCIAPAGILTPMVAQSNLNDPGFNESQYLRQHPLQRWGQPQDIAALAAFLASDEATYLNGAILVADGGSTLRPFFL